MITDFHTHCFPDALAEKALGRLAVISEIPYYTGATCASNLAAMKEAGIDRAVIFNIATNPKQTNKVNDFAIETAALYPNLIPFGSVHPESEPDFIEAELRRLKDAGIKGIKLHPDYMECPIDDEKYTPIFATCCELNLTISTHAGWDFYSPDFIHATPERIARVLAAYPELRLVAAHMGGYKLGEDVLRHLAGKRVWFDTSLLALAEDKALMREILLSHDPDKLLFATDTPWSRMTDELAALESMELPEKLMVKILNENAEVLLKE